MNNRAFPPATGQVPPGAIGHNRGVVCSNYAFMPPEGVLVSRLPQYRDTIVRVLTGPVMGAAFAQYVLEIAPGGGTPAAFGEDGIQHFFYVLSGEARIVVAGGAAQALTAGGFAYLPPATSFTLRNESAETLRVLALRKRYEAAPGLAVPEPIVSHQDAVPMANHTGMEGRGFQFLLPYGDMRFDFEMNLMWFKPGVCFPAVETHVMEHGLYVLEGKAVYKLNQDWVEVEAGDFMWLRAYCPQACYAGGPGPFRYLLYKDVNRHAKLRGPGAFGPAR